MPRSAVVIGDLQLGITRTYPFAAELVPRAAALAAAARAHGDLVAFVRTEFRAGGADVSPRNARVRAVFDMGDDYHEGSRGVELDPELGREPADVIVTKQRGSAFAHTDLDMILRARDIGSVIVAGVATSAMVAATVYDAADRDYIVRVARDVAADPDPAVHDALVSMIFPVIGVDVVTSAELWPAR